MNCKIWRVVEKHLDEESQCVLSKRNKYSRSKNLSLKVEKWAADCDDWEGWEDQRIFPRHLRYFNGENMRIWEHLEEYYFLNDEEKNFFSLWWETRLETSPNKKILVCKGIVIFSLVYLKNMILIELWQGKPKGYLKMKLKACLLNHFSVKSFSSVFLTKHVSWTYTEASKEKYKSFGYGIVSWHAYRIPWAKPQTYYAGSE